MSKKIETGILLEEINSVITEIASRAPLTIPGENYLRGYVNALKWVKGLIIALAEGEKSDA